MDQLAKEKGVCAISGSSSVPGLSYVVLDHFTNSSNPNHIDTLQKVEYFISVGGNTPARGIGTMKSVLSYCGKPFEVLKDGSYKTVYGFQRAHKKNYSRVSFQKICVRMQHTRLFSVSIKVAVS